MPKGNSRGSPSEGKGGRRRGGGSSGKKSETPNNGSGSKNAKGKGGNKGDGKSFKKDNSGSLTGAKTVQEIEAKMLLSGLAKGKGDSGSFERSKERELAKQPLEAKGSQCEVRKHSEMGCAVITFKSEAMRDAVMNIVEKKVEKGSEERPTIKVAGIDVQMRPHFDKVQHEEVKTDIFVAWGRQAEKQAPLAAATLADAVDELVLESDILKDVPVPAPVMPPTFPVPMMPTGVAAPTPVPVQAPLFTTQVASPPMASAPMVASSPMPQPAVSQPGQPGTYVDLGKFINWGQAHPIPQQPMTPQAPMPPPPTASPAATATAPQPGMVAQPAPMPLQAPMPQPGVVAQPVALQTPPAQPALTTAPPAAYPQGVMAPVTEMRVEAPAFQYAAPQHNYFDQRSNNETVQNYFDQNANTEADQYAYWNGQMQNGLVQSPTKRFDIKNPETGEVVQQTNLFMSPASTKTPLGPPTPQRLVIKDPKSGDTLDVSSMFLTPPKTKSGFTIRDQDGVPIKV